ncbi:hypothetical protein BDV95DRAFT_536439 [Massariosphaeria phaeospora]|uniref:Uncharacterized protein n=1 Tax=Massariosphaeria phaeospora TaxID=100035 RepID=A0A7C8MH19_9PLEO|nr:hypothetical protein BDV95DRAFT_536439 [Massariosphaeria phaeospora]
MAARKSDAARRDAKPDDADASPLAHMMREFEELVWSFETSLLCSLDHDDSDDSHPHLSERRGPRREAIRHQACRLAISELSSNYRRKQIRQSLHTAESLAKNVEEVLLSSATGGLLGEDLTTVHNGHFRLYSSELFEMLGQPTDLRFGTLRFHAHPSTASLDVVSLEGDGDDDANHTSHLPWVSLEMALNSSFFVADSLETLPLHAFRMPEEPSLQNRGILSRKLDDGGAFPDYDSWLLFTFLGNGCLKLEVPVEMCADVYGGPLVGRENEEVVFWGVFVEDEAVH